MPEEVLRIEHVDKRFGVRDSVEELTEIVVDQYRRARRANAA